MMREFEIERQFDLKIESIKPHKGVYYLKTNKGERCLKKINFGVQKLLFVYGAKEHLAENGFKNLDRYFLNKDGEPYALVNEDLYTLSEWINGRECDFHNIDEIEMAAKQLAKMHLCSEGYDPPENSKLKTDIGRWPHLMEKRIKSLDKMRDMARKKNMKHEFDLTYIKSMEFYKKLAVRALNVLKDSDYMKICEDSEAAKILCHHDYTYHNIIIDQNEEINIIDFDYCKREVRAYDISNFMTKVLKKSDWNVTYAKRILDAYNSVYPLKDNEYKVLFSYLLFPQRYWRLANRYYYNEVTWAQNTFVNKIQNIIKEQENYNNFIEEFKKIYDQKE